MTATTQSYAAPPTPAELAARLGIPLERIVKLDANEAPWGLAPSARAALASRAAMAGSPLGSAGRYPDASSTMLREALARYTEVPAESIVVGNGSDEIIQLLVDALVQPGDEVIVSEPTFSVYALAAKRRGARVVDVGRDAGWRTPVEALSEAMTTRTRLVFLCSPNNPTGTPLDSATLDAALARAQALAASTGGVGPVVVVDEAYYEVGALAGNSRVWTAAPRLPSAGGRLVILRTFSKVFGLAGLRVGYGLGDASLMRQLRDLKAPYNVNLAGQVAALAALDDLDWLRARTVELAQERQRLAKWLSAQVSLRVEPSAANFLLVDVAPNDNGSAARERRRDGVWRALLDEGVMTRRLSGPRLDGMLRVTVGLPEQNDALMAVLARALAREE